MQLPGRDDPMWVGFLHEGARLVERGWREHGITMPAGVADVLGRVTWEHVRNGRISIDEGFFSFPGSRLFDLVRTLEKELPGGAANSRFLEVLTERLDQSLVAYENEMRDPDASA